MRLTAVLIIASLMQVSAAGFAQKLSLSEENTVLTTVLDKIRKQTGFDFILSDRLLGQTRPVTIRVTNKDLKDVLFQIFKDQPLSYTIEDNFIVVTKKEDPLPERQLTPFSLVDISGKIYDESGNPLPGASIRVKGKSKTVTTDINGLFSLKGIDEDAVLEISYIGYVGQEVKAKSNLYVILKLSTAELKEVTVNKGYYSESRVLSTGNSSGITSKEIGLQPISNALLAMQGQIAGIQIIQTSGITNGPVKVLIRGNASIGSVSPIGLPIESDPLYIIDGVPYPSKLLIDPAGNTGGRTTDQNPGGNPLNFFNPSDIERIDVLKDADATSIYGSRGANGVILITTKKGKVGPMVLDAQVSTGISIAPTKLKLLNTQQYLDMRREAFKNDGLPVPSIVDSPNDMNYDLNGLWSQDSYTDWQKELVGKKANYTNANISLSGGNVLTQYMISGTFNRQTTVFPGSEPDIKGGLHFNIKSSTANRKAGITFSGNYLLDNNRSTQSDLSAFILRAPNAPSSFDNNGNLNWGGSNYDNKSNPYAKTFNGYENKTDNLVLNLRPTIELAKGLEFQANLGLTRIQSNIVTTFPTTSLSPLAIAQGNAASAYYTDNSQKTWIIEPHLSYNAQFGKLKLSSLLGTTFQQASSQMNLVTGYGYTDDALISDPGGAQSVAATRTGKSYKYNAIFGRVNANFLDRYVINATARRDGSSRFGSNKQFANFYAIGAAWIFTNEEILKDKLSFLSSGKLRGSYGTAGNDGIGDYVYFDLYTTRFYPYQGVVGLYPTQFANPDAAWEINKKLEVAIELSTLNDRISFSGSYYQNRSSNQLLSAPLPAFTGFPSLPGYNLPAKVQNSGYELSLSSTNIRNKNLTWNTSFNISFNRNKLLAFPNIEQSPYANTLVVGQPIAITKVFDYKGVDPATGLYTFKLADGSISSEPDYDGDKTAFVNTVPKYFGGLTNSVRFKNLQLDVFFQFVKQNGLESLTPSTVTGQFDYDNQTNVTTDLLDRWQKPGDVAKYQRFSTLTYAEAQYAHSSYLVSNGNYGDASYIRLRNVSLSYTIPGKWMEKIRLKSFRVFMQGQNLLTFTKYKGRDPETQSYDALPIMKIVTAGIQITL